MAGDRNEVEIVVKATDQTKGFAETRRGAKELTAEISKAEAELQALGKIRSRPEIEADTKVAETKIAATAAKLEELRAKPTSPKIEADIAVAERNLQRLEGQLQGLKGEAAAQINVRADTAAAEARLAALKAEARELDGMKPEITPEVNSAPAESKLAKFGDGAKTAVGAAGAVAGGVFVAGLANSMELDSASQKLKAQMDWSPEFMADLGKTSGDLYAQGYGDSLGSVNDALRNVVTSGALAEDASSDQISGITKSAMSLADAFDVDVSQSMMAVSRMVSTDLVPSAEAGLDLITRSFQELGPGAEDVLDTLTEYPTQFQKAGLSGEAAMTMVKQMMDAGARSTDLAADAIKEFSIRAQDGSKTSLDAYKAIGLNGEEMTKKFAKGGQDARDVMELVIGKLKEMPPGFERNSAAIGLFGTQAEDLGDSLYAINFDGVERGLGKTEGAAARLNDTLGDTAQNKVDQLTRGFEQWTASLISTDGPIGDVAAGISAFGPMALEVLGSLGPLVMALKMSGVADAIRSGPAAAVDDLGGKVEKTEGKAGRLKGVLGGLGGALALGAGIVALSELQTSIDGGKDKADDFTDGLHDMSDAIGQIGSGDFGGIFSDIEAEWKQMVRHLSGENSFEFDVDTGPAAEQVSTFMNALKGQVGTVEINGRTEDASQALANIIQTINNGGGDVTINGQTMDAQAALDLVVKQINDAGGMVEVNGNMVPAGDALKMFLGDVQRTVAALVIDGNTDPVTQKTTAAVEFANGSTGVITLDGDPHMVDGKVEQAVMFADGSKGTVTIDGNPDPATGKVWATVRYADGSTGRILVDARTGQAETAINWAARNRSMTITVNWAGLDRNINPAIGGGRITGATGGIMSGGMTLVGERGPELVKRHAAGGVTSAGMQWVGEQGPELVNLAPGAMVYPSGQSKQMAGAAGGGGVQALQIMFGGNVDGAFATAFQMLVRTGKIQLKGVNI